MDIGTPLIANSQPTELVQPSQGPLYHPTIGSQSTTVLGIALAQDRLNPQRPQRLPVRLRVISSVSLNLLRSPTRAASPAPNWWNGLHHGQQLGHVVAISPRQDGGQRDSLGIGNQVMFAPQLASVSGIGPSFSPHLPPLGRRHYPPLLETSLYGPLVVVWPAIVHAASARPRLSASLEGGANNSCLSRIPSPWATFPRECRFSGQTEFQSAPDGPAKACGQGNATGGVLGAAARAVSVAIIHPLSMVSPSTSPPHKGRILTTRHNPKINSTLFVRDSKEFEKENIRLKRLVADLSLNKDILKEALQGNP